MNRPATPELTDSPAVQPDITSALPLPELGGPGSRLSSDY